MDLRIRPGGYNDLPTIFDLVKELADYEKEPESVTALLSDYQKAFEDNKIYILVAEHQGAIVGMMVYYDAFSTWRGPMIYLEDFVVSQPYRSMGVGQQLFDAFIADAKAKGAVMVKWEVLDWNELAINFYKKNGAMIETNWWDGKIIF